MEFQLSYFKSWKMMLWKCYTQYASKFAKVSSGHRTGKGQFSFQSLRKAMPKNAQTTAQLHSSHTLVKAHNLQARLQQYMNCELPDVQAGFRKGRGTRDRISNNCWIIKKAREFQKNIYFCFTDYAKAFDCVGHNKLWKILKEMFFWDSLAFLMIQQMLAIWSLVPLPFLKPAEHQYTAVSSTVVSESKIFLVNR